MSNFKKYSLAILSLILSIGLGYLTFRLLLLVFHTSGGSFVPTAELIDGIISLGSIFVYYSFLLKKFSVIPEHTTNESSLEQIQPTRPRTKIIYIVTGLVLFILGFILPSYLFHYLSYILGVKVEEAALSAVSTWFSITVCSLGIFYYPYILSKQISNSKKILFCMLYLFSPVMVVLLLSIF